MKIRQNLYIDRDLGDALDALVIRRGGNKSRIVNAALRDWLARRASKDVDDLLKVRLDRISREVAAGRRDIEGVPHALALFVRSQPTLPPPPPQAAPPPPARGNPP